MWWCRNKKSLTSGWVFGLVSMDNVRFLKGATYDEEIKFTIQNIRISNKIIKQSGIATVRNMLIAEATWVCARIDKA
jgi:3-hydroxyacyl-[acyl-carrier-protein] dehydratase